MRISFQHQRWGRFMCYLLATAPHWVIPFTLYPTAFGKVPIFLLVVALLLLVYTWECWRRPTLLAEQEKRRDWHAYRWLVACLWLYFFAYVVTSLTGERWIRSLFGQESRQNGGIVLLSLVLYALLLPRFLEKKEHWRTYFRWLVYPSGVIGWLAIAELLVPPFGALFGDTHRAALWFGNPIFLGGYLVIAGGIALLLRIWCVGRERFVVNTALAGMLLGVYATGSRGPMLAALVGGGVGVLAWVLSSRHQKDLVREVLRVLAIGAGALVSIFFVAWLLPGPDRILGLEHWVDQNSSRFIAWEIAWLGFLERPVLGWGPQNYQIVFDRFYDPELLRFSLSEQFWDKPHNLPLELLATGGVVLAVTFFALIWIALRATCVHRQRGRISPMQSAIIYGTVAAYLVHTFFLFNQFRINILLFTLFGFLVLPPGDDARQGMRPWRPRFSLRTYATLAALVFTPLVLWYVAVVIPKSFVTKKAVEAVYAMAYAPNSASRFKAQEEWRLWSRRVVSIESPHDRELHKHMLWVFLGIEAFGLLDSSFVHEEIPFLLAIASHEAFLRRQVYQIQYVYARTLILSGELTVNPDDFEKARRTLDWADTLSPERQLNDLLRGRILLAEGRSAEAVDLLERLVAQDPVASDPKYFLLLATMAANDPVRAAVVLQELFEMGSGPKSATEGTQFAAWFVERGQRAKTVPIYRWLIASDQNNAEWHWRLAEAWAAAGNAPLAILAAQEAARLDAVRRPAVETFIQSLRL